MINKKHLRVLNQLLVVIALSVIIAIMPLSAKADAMQQSFTQPVQPYLQNYTQQPLVQTPNPNQFVDNRQYLQTNYYGQNCYPPSYGPNYPVNYGYNDRYYYGRNPYFYNRPGIYINANLGHFFGGFRCRGFGFRGCGRR